MKQYNWLPPEQGVDIEGFVEEGSIGSAEEVAKVPIAPVDSATTNVQAPSEQKPADSRNIIDGDIDIDRFERTPGKGWIYDRAYPSSY